MDQLDGWRVWPPSGGHTLLEDMEKVAEAPPPAADVSLEGMSSRLVSWVRGDIPIKKSTIQSSKLWRQADAAPAVLLLMFVDRYGQEALEWEAETIRTTLERDGLAPSNSSYHKLMAAITLVMSPSPWRQWDVFHYVCRGLAGEAPNFQFLEEPELGHLLAGYELMQQIDPEREPTVEIDKFVAAAFRSSGVVYLPPPLDFAQKELEGAKLSCKACGAIHRDDNDVRCISCGSIDLHPIPYAYAERRDKLKAFVDRAQNLPLDKVLELEVDEDIKRVAHHLAMHLEYAADVRRETAKQLRSLL